MSSQRLLTGATDKALTPSPDYVVGIVDNGWGLGLSDQRSDEETAMAESQRREGSGINW